MALEKKAIITDVKRYYIILKYQQSSDWSRSTNNKIEQQ